MNRTNGKQRSTGIQTEIKEPVMVVYLDRSEKRNALNDEMMRELAGIFSNPPSGIKAAIIAGKGAHFSSGLDLTEVVKKDVVNGIHHSRMWHDCMNLIQFGKFPVVALLHGACIGGGLELASACHIRVAESDTFYAMPEGQRGIFVGGGASARLPKLIGASRFTDLMLTGRVLDAQEGYQMGLSQYLVNKNEGMEKAMELASQIAKNAEITNYALIHVLPRIAESSQDQGLMMESLMAAIAQDTPEAKKRMKKFLEGKAKKIQSKNKKEKNK